MPEIKKNLEQIPELEKQSELLIPSKEQGKDFKAPEKIQETETLQKEVEKPSESINQASTSQQKVVSSPINDRLKGAIDDILEEGLEDIYLDLPKEKQKEFKIKGEEATNKILGLLSETKIKIRKIVQIIIEWLKIVPGVNKFFIKQTAKIKTDKILAAKKEESLEK